MNHEEHFARHGGVHFENLVPPEEINRFVNNLSDEQRSSLFEVLHQLSDAGLIRIRNDHVWADGEGNTGGSQEC